jgi:O-antigen/teichoic acid export membrane protein
MMEASSVAAQWCKAINIPSKCVEKDFIKMAMYLKTVLAYLSLGRTPDSKLDLSVAIGSTVIRQIVSGTLYLIALWITARQLGPQKNGTLATVLLLPQTLYAFLNLGLGASHVYHLSSGSGNHDRMRHTNWILAFILWLVVFIVLVMSSAKNIAKYLPGIEKNLALYASMLLPMMLLASWSSSLIQGNRDYKAYNKIVLIQPSVFCVAVIFLYVSNLLTVISVISCYLVSQASLWLLSEVKINGFSTPTHNAKHGFPDGIKYGLKAHMSNVITFMNYRMALYLVSYTLGAAATGKYALSIQLAEMLWLISSSASMIVFPESAAHSKSPEELRKMIKKIASSVFQVTLVGALLAAAASPFAIPWIFGKEYEGAVIPFIILLPGIVAWSYMTVISNSLAGMGHQKINIESALLCLSINIVGDLLAIPKFGAVGAALVSTIAFSITALYTVVIYARIITKKSLAYINQHQL